MRKTYTAKLCSNTRDNNISSVKALLIDIFDESSTVFRDHCWVQLTKELTKYQPKQGRNKPITITFTAKVKDYVSVEGNDMATKQKLISIRDITV